RLTTMWHLPEFMWSEALNRYWLAMSGNPAAKELAEDPMYAGDVWRSCETIYRALLTTPFEQSWRELCGPAVQDLVKQAAEIINSWDLGALRAQVQWEAARALVALPEAPPTAG